MKRSTSQKGMNTRVSMGTSCSLSLLLFLLALAIPTGGQNIPKLKTLETTIRDASPGREMQDTLVVVSPNNRRLAYVTKGSKPYVVVDNEGHPYDNYLPGSLNFSQDSKHCAYAAALEGKFRVYVDGVAGPAYEAVSPPVFSPNSERVAYAAKSAGSLFVVVVKGTHQEGRHYDLVSPPLFSPDSSRVIYGAGKEGKQFVVDNEQEGEAFVAVGLPVISERGGRLAYAAQTQAGWCVVDGAKKGENYERVLALRPTLSPNGKRLAYGIRRNGKQYIYCDGKLGNGYDQILSPGIVFSPLSTRMAYCAERDSKTYVVVDGKESLPYDGISGGLIFSKNDTRFAFTAIHGVKRCVVADDKEGRLYAGISYDPVFSPDGSRMAYGAIRGGDRQPSDEILGGERFIVVDGMEGKSYHFISDAGLLFSKDGKHVAYIATTGGYQEGAQNDKNVFLVGGKKRSVIVVDGVESDSFSGVYIGSKLIFDSPTRLRAVGFRGSARLIIEVDILSG